MEDYINNSNNSNNKDFDENLEIIIMCQMIEAMIMMREYIDGIDID